MLINWMAQDFRLVCGLHFGYRRNVGRTYFQSREKCSLGVNVHRVLIDVLNNRLNYGAKLLSLLFPAYKLFILFLVYFGCKPLSYSTLMTDPAVINFSVIKKLKLQVGFSNFYQQLLIFASHRIFEPVKQICLVVFISPSHSLFDVTRYSLTNKKARWQFQFRQKKLVFEVASGQCWPFFRLIFHFLIFSYLLKYCDIGPLIYLCT